MYNQFKNQMIEEFEAQRDTIVASEQFNGVEPLFEFQTSDDKLYAKILRAFETIAIKNSEKLISALLEKYHIAYSQQVTNTTKWDIEAFLNGEKVYIELMCNRVSLDSSKIRKYSLEALDLDAPIYLVHLLKDTPASQRLMERFKQQFIKDNVSEKIHSVLFEDFISLAFGNQEKTSFQKAMVGFRDSFIEHVGYQITEICSNYNLERMKNALDWDISNMPYEQIRTDLFSQIQSENSKAKTIYSQHFNSILSEYLNRGKYKMLLSSASFAKSFLSSEWLYRKYVALESLDNTFIVTGYLKSIEQLLWDILTVVGQGRSIKGEVIDCGNNTQANQTLGALSAFFKNENNEDLFRDCFGNSTYYVRWYFIDFLDHWTKKARNGYFHKHELIKDPKNIEAIRNETLLLYCLILGSLKLSKEDISKIIK